MVRVLLLLAVSSTACASRAPKLQEPIGQTTAGSTAPRDATTVNAAPEVVAEGLEPYLAGKSAGPCGRPPPSMIEFNASSTEIAEPRLQELRHLADCLNAPPYETASVVLVGYTDVIGTVPANLELGLTRAQVVMRHLMSSGVAPGRIVIASAGELQRPQARRGMEAPRVEVFLARGGPPHPDEAPVARGIEAEGLLPRPRPAASASPTPPSRPAARPTPASGAAPSSPARPRGR